MSSESKDGCLFNRFLGGEKSPHDLANPCVFCRESGLRAEESILLERILWGDKTPQEIERIADNLGVGKNVALALEEIISGTSETLKNAGKEITPESIREEISRIIQTDAGNKIIMDLLACASVADCSTDEFPIDQAWRDRSKSELLERIGSERV